MKLVWCPPGFVTMEQADEIEEPDAPNDGTQNEPPGNSNDDEVVDKPAPKTRKVTKITHVKTLVTRGYWLGRYEVTQSEWKQVMQTEPWKGEEHTDEGDDFPATFVSWEGAMDFCRTLTEREREAGRLPDGWRYTLPTEAEWERACRARTESSYSFGDDESKLGEYAWFVRNAFRVGEEYAHRVGQKKPNAWGLFDMHGNVWEWCRDLYSPRLPGGRDPEVSNKGKNRVFRGGAFNHPATNCRSAKRNGIAPDYGFWDLGFRVALSPVRHADADAARTVDK
jgi:formylglycine-generating enzyme required for sulfatase activity